MVHFKQLNAFFSYRPWWYSDQGHSQVHKYPGFWMCKSQCQNWLYKLTHEEVGLLCLTCWRLGAIHQRRRRNGTQGQHDDLATIGRSLASKMVNYHMVNCWPTKHWLLPLPPMSTMIVGALPMSTMIGGNDANQSTKEPTDRPMKREDALLGDQGSSALQNYETFSEVRRFGWVHTSRVN